MFVISDIRKEHRILFNDRWSRSLDGSAEEWRKKINENAKIQDSPPSPMQPVFLIVSIVSQFRGHTYVLRV
jgi:hypothetical protein